MNKKLLGEFKKRTFNCWFAMFRTSINEYGYYTDFKKVYKNIENLKVEINILNSLVGSNDIENEFEKILIKYPECLKLIPILLAVREYEIYCQDEKHNITYRFDKFKQSIEQYKYFMRKTGLFNMLKKHVVSNLHDYLMGIEVGLDSNGRKNRGGHQMEELVERYIKKAGFVKNKTYFKGMCISNIEIQYHVNLSTIPQSIATKIWDFVIKTNKQIYVIETNFYSVGGSKLNETARSYKLIAVETKNIKNFDFVWITDGGGWISARKNLEETFNTMNYIFNIKEMEDGLFERLN